MDIELSNKKSNNVINLPYDVGDWFYLLYYRNNEWTIWTDQIEVIRVNISDQGFAVKLYGIEVAVEDRELNKTLFLNYGAAIKACQERNGKDDPSGQNSK